jgi:adenosine/AMP kinase
MPLSTVDIVKPGNTHFVPGPSHFIKTVEDLHEADAVETDDDMHWRKDLPRAIGYKA